MANGLLSNPAFNVGIGLLAANAPTTEPTSIGRRLAQGFQTGSQLTQQAQTAEQQRLENRLARQQLQQRAAQQAAQSRLQGLLQPSVQLSAGQEPGPQMFQGGTITDEQVGGLVDAQVAPGIQNVGQTELMGLLAQAQPEQFTQSLIQSQFAGQDVPEEVQLAQFAFPDNPQAQREAVMERLTQASSQEQLDALKVRLAMLDAEQRQREIREAQQTERGERASLSDSLQNSLSDAEKMLDLLDQLEGTPLQPGAGLTEARRGVAGALGAAQEAITGERSPTQEAADAFDQFAKLSSRFAVDAAQRLFDEGAITNFQLRSIQQQSPNPGITPAANRQVIADQMRFLLQAADRNDITIPNRSRFEEVLNRLRGDEQPSRQSGRRRIPPRRIQSMGQEELFELDIDTLDREQRRAARRRLQDLGFTPPEGL